MDKVEIKITSDGSHTLELPSLNETYHSKHGAIQEAIHVFIEAGLKYSALDSVRIIEFGFGTGLNCMLTLMEAEKLNKIVNYTAVEAYPLETQLIEQLNYPKLLALTQQEDKLFELIHEIPWDDKIVIKDGFNLSKVNKRFEQLNTRLEYDLIYYDAFGPRVQPELWNETMMKLLFSITAINGVVVTYCAKGSVKRGLRAAGFEVETLPGPPGKREMIRATKLK